MINIALTLKDMICAFIQGVCTFGQLLYDILFGYAGFMSAPKFLGDILDTFNCPTEIVMFLNGNWFAAIFSVGFGLSLFVILNLKLIYRIIQFVNPLN